VLKKSFIFETAFLFVLKKEKCNCDKSEQLLAWQRKEKLSPAEIASCDLERAAVILDCR
jgi:hypothetical protein